MKLLAIATCMAASVTSAALAAPATYQLDTAHTDVGFGIRHLGLNTVRGVFKTVSGTIDFDPKSVAADKINIEIDAASIDTGNEKRDGHVKSADFLDVAKFPKITFASKSVKASGKGKYQVTGELTLRGVTKPVTLQVAEFAGPAVSPLDKKNHIGASVTGVINRQDFGIVWNAGGATGVAGEAALGNEIKLQFDVDGVEADAAAAAAPAAK